MRNHRILYRIRHVSICLLVLIGGHALAQLPEVVGIGLSGDRSDLRVVVQPGDSLFFIAAFNLPDGLDPIGVGLGDGLPDRLRLFYYTSESPNSDFLRAQTIIEVDSAAVEIDLEADPPTIRFESQLPVGVAQDIRSFQLEVGIYALNLFQIPVWSETRVSHIEENGIPDIGDPVDEFHATFLTVSHFQNNRPEIAEPGDQDTLAQRFEIIYSQPFDAIPGSHTVEFISQGIFDSQTWTVYVNDASADEQKILELNGENLGGSVGVDSVDGPTSLLHDSLLTIRVAYRLTNGNPSDTAIVEEVLMDLRTEPLTFLVPDIGTSSEYPDLPMLYRLEENAQTLTLRIEADPSSLFQDLLSPHILTLVPEVTSSGLHDFMLDGSDLGTDHALVQTSNHGPLDSIFSHVVYNVTLEYRDLAGNDPVVEINHGYIWPEDQITMPPGIVSPLNGTADNRSYWVEFTLPEDPLPGSVRIQFDSFQQTPGSPHNIYLGNLAASGSVGLTLNALAFDHSNPPVTHIEGGPNLLHGFQYLFRIFYQDLSGNLEAGNGRMIWFDDVTEPPLIFAPSTGDTLPLLNETVIFEQPEDAIPGTLQMILTQTGGPELDPLSPHTMYLSDPALATASNPKVVYFDPAFVGPGPGIDSVHNAGSLVSRGTYQLSVVYQDTLANAFGENHVSDLYFPSGSQVTARGSYNGTAVIPGEKKQHALTLALKAIGSSALRGLTLTVEGEVRPQDIDAEQVILWSSVDSIFHVDQDTPIDTLQSWFGGPMLFDSFARQLDENESYFHVSLAYTESADPGNTIGILIWNSTDIDCGGDPVTCLNCPIGPRDVALPIELTSFFIEDPREFGALKLIWDVASETNNEGFNVWRKDEGQEEFHQVASFTEYPELYGRGTSAAKWRYRFIDRDLTPGQTYIYRIEVVSIGGFETQMAELEATGSPRIPPDNFILRNAYPNPSNPRTTIEYVVPYVANVEITIYNLLGQRVRELVRAQLAPAIYRTVWDGLDDRGMQVPSGVYIYRMFAGNIFNESRKLLLVR